MIRLVSPKRGAKGTIDGALLLRLPDALRARIDRAAQQQGLSSSEWIRRVVQEALK